MNALTTALKVEGIVFEVLQAEMCDPCIIITPQLHIQVADYNPAGKYIIYEDHLEIPDDKGEVGYIKEIYTTSDPKKVIAFLQTLKIETPKLN